MAVRGSRAQALRGHGMKTTAALVHSCSSRPIAAWPVARAFATPDPAVGDVELLDAP
jgi:hypothetical protein